MWYNYRGYKDLSFTGLERSSLPLAEAFFNRPTLVVARELLGKKLVREINGIQLSGMVVETEAYIGRADTACHASKGRTPRTEVMFGPSGRAYVYLVYGMHFMLNAITEAEGNPCAVLIRAIAPLEGLALMEAHRRQTNHLTDGPGRLCQALAIDTRLNGHNLADGRALWLDDFQLPAEELVGTGPRIGIAYASPTDQLAPWRFWLKQNPFVSRQKLNQM